MCIMCDLVGKGECTIDTEVDEDYRGATFHIKHTPKGGRDVEQHVTIRFTMGDEKKEPSFLIVNEDSGDSVSIMPPILGLFFPAMEEVAAKIVDYHDRKDMIIDFIQSIQHSNN